PAHYRRCSSGSGRVSQYERGRNKRIRYRARLLSRRPVHSPGDGRNAVGPGGRGALTPGYGRGTRRGTGARKRPPTAGAEAWACCRIEKAQLPGSVARWRNDVRSVGEAAMLMGKVVIVTGAARGIGREYCVRFAGMGAIVVAADVSPCEATVVAAREAGGRVVGHRMDVTDLASVIAVTEGSVAEFGRIDGLVNNAALYGALRGGRFDSLPEKDWDAAMAVNVKGVWNCCKAVVPRMRQGGGGSIVNISSLAATYGMPFGLHYTTS